MNRLRDEIVRRNRDASDSWQRYAPHRRRVTQLLLAAFESAKAADPPAAAANVRLCVLGAGNLNDLELPQLAAAYSALHLVDLDEAALRAGVDRQTTQAGLEPAALERIVLHGGVDVSGVLERMGEWQPGTPPDPAALEATIGAAAAAPAPLAGERFAVVGSICLLSQLVFAALAALGGEHPRFAELVAALRLRHLQMLLELAAPGGAAVLVHDFVSSDSLPQMTSIPEQQFPAALRQVMQTSNVFFGLSPLRLEYLLQTDAGLAGRAASRRWSPAWRWNFGPRSYAVTAVTLRLPAPTA